MEEKYDSVYSETIRQQDMILKALELSEEIQKILSGPSEWAAGNAKTTENGYIICEMKTNSDNLEQLISNLEKNMKKLI